MGGGGASASVTLKKRRTAGGVLLGVGGAAAVGGFVMSYVMYKNYYWEADTTLYNWGRNNNIAGFAIGVAGACVGATGLLLVVLPDGSNRSTALTPGPVTTFSMEF